MEREIIIQILLCLAIGYFFGCINPAFIVGKKKGYDVRKSGSGNAGASNTLIMAGKLAGLSVALLDIIKAAASWQICQALFPELELAGVLGGVACILGHMYPVFLRFKGGKGLACLGGVILAYDPKGMLLMLIVALAIGAISNYVCVVTVAMSVIFPMYYGCDSGFWLGAWVLLIPSVPIFIKHIANFRRIGTGQELHLSYLWNKDGELHRAGYED